MKRIGQVLALGMSAVLAAGVLTGCSIGRGNNQTEKLDNLVAEGIVTTQESTLGIPMNTKEITEILTDGMFYVLHGDTLYPLYVDYSAFQSEAPEDYVNYKRQVVYTSETAINIPTLFEGDKLYYFSHTGVVSHFIVERFEDLGWSIGLRDLKVTQSGKHVYVNLDDTENGEPALGPEFSTLKTISREQLLLDKIGGIRITPDFVEDGIVVGLNKGSNYDIEIYNGTNYYYYNSDCNIRYFQALELYALDEYLPLQDYLYEVEIPDYLLPGYYNFNNMGLVRLVRGTSYDEEFTNFNEKLLYQYMTHEEGDMTKDEEMAPYIYSENPLLNKFTAYDAGYFGYIDPEVAIEESPETTQDKLNSFKEATKVSKKLWLPDKRECSISVVTPETTGSIYLVLENGNRKMLVYNRLTGAYELTINGRGVVADLEIQGLFQSYSIKLTNAASYSGQDKLVPVQPTSE